MRNVDQPYRVAVYWAPKPDSVLWQTGSRWLGRDAATGEALQQPEVPGVPVDVLQRLTAEPRRYGLHATLKAPFRLRAGLSLADVDTAMQRLVQSHSAQALGLLRVETMGSFLALRPAGSMDGINALAAACVQQLQALAEPLTEADVQRRRAKLSGSRLSAHQEELLLRWGYPWVLDEFRFHCSLTGDLGAPDAPAAPHTAAALLAAASEGFHHLPEQTVDSLAVFLEPEPGADFRLHRHWDLAPALASA
jgi:hypothetical protein